MRYVAVCCLLYCLFYFAHAQNPQDALYGISMETLQLVIVDPETAAYKAVGPPLNEFLYAQELATIDDANKIYYVLGFNTDDSLDYLVGIDLFTGNIKIRVKLPFQSGGFIGVGQTCNFDPTTGDVIVSGRDPAVNNQHHILRVTPTTGQIQSIATIGDIDVLGGSAVFDWGKGIQWLQYGVNDPKPAIYLFGFDVKTGKQVYSLDNTANMETMDYDPNTGLIFGVGLRVVNNTIFNRTLVTLDSSTGKFNEIAVIPNNYFIIQASIAALDLSRRLLMCYLQPQPYEKNYPFQLVSLDLKTGKVVRNPNATSIPWSFEYHNTPIYRQANAY